jgi:hypothetical protein
MPAIRTVFSIFFLIPLFNKILRLANNKGYKHNYSSVLLFLGYLIINLLSMLPTPFYIAGIISFIFLIPPFKALNFAFGCCEEFSVVEQYSFSRRQIFLLIAGVIIWILVIAGIISTGPLI